MEWLDSALARQQQANLWGRKRGDAPFKLDNFLLNRKREKEMTPEETDTAIRAMAAQHNIARKNGRKTIPRDKEPITRRSNKSEKLTDNRTDATRISGTRKRSRREPKS